MILWVWNDGQKVVSYSQKVLKEYIIFIWRVWLPWSGQGVVWFIGIKLVWRPELHCLLFVTWLLFSFVSRVVFVVQHRFESCFAVGYYKQKTIVLDFLFVGLGSKVFFLAGVVASPCLLWGEGGGLGEKGGFSLFLGLKRADILSKPETKDVQFLVKLWSAPSQNISVVPC